MGINLYGRVKQYQRKGSFFDQNMKQRIVTPQLSRTGISLDEDLLKEFDRLINNRGYQNRSEALRDFIREALLAGQD